MLFVTIGAVGRSRATPPHVKLIAERLDKAMRWRDVGFNELDTRAGQGGGFTSKFLALKKQSLDVLVAEQIAEALDVPYAWLVQGRGRMEDGYDGGQLESSMRASADPDNIDLAALADRRFGPAIVDVVRAKAADMGVKPADMSPEQWREKFVFEARRQLVESAATKRPRVRAKRTRSPPTETSPRPAPVAKKVG